MHHKSDNVVVKSNYQIFKGLSVVCILMAFKKGKIIINRKIGSISLCCTSMKLRVMLNFFLIVY